VSVFVRLAVGVGGGVVVGEEDGVIVLVGDGCAEGDGVGVKPIVPVDVAGGLGDVVPVGEAGGIV
jgi:hypothetical protein